MEKQTCKCGKMNCTCKKLMIWVVVILAIVIGFFYFNKVSAPTDEVSNIEVTENEDGTKTVRNVEEGFEVVVGEDKYVNSENGLAIQNFKEPEPGYGGTPGCKVSVESSLGYLDNIYRDVEESCSLDSECTDHKIEEIEKNGTWYVIKYFGEYVGSGLPEYKTQNGSNVYTLYFNCDDEDFIDSILSNFLIS